MHDMPMDDGTWHCRLCKRSGDGLYEDHLCGKTHSRNVMKHADLTTIVAKLFGHSPSLARETTRKFFGLKESQTQILLATEISRPGYVSKYRQRYFRPLLAMGVQRGRSDRCFIQHTEMINVSRWRHARLPASVAQNVRKRKSGLPLDCFHLAT